jgi:predicted aspartyl protease
VKEIAMKPVISAAVGAAILLVTSTAALAQLSDVDIKSAVEAKGYTNVKITHHEKSHVDVTATKNGKTMKLAVDPQTGAVRPDTDKD